MRRAIRRPRLPVLLACGVLALAAAGAAAHGRAREAAQPRHARAPLEVADATVRLVSSKEGAGMAFVDVDGQRSVLVLDEDDGALVLVDVASQHLRGRATLGGTPGQLVVAPDGTVLVAVRGAAEVVALRVRADGALREVARRATGDEPFGLALGTASAADAGDATLFVTTIGSAQLEAYRASDLAPRFSVALPRDPRSVVLAADEGRAFVSHATGSRMSVVELHAEGEGPTVREVSLRARERRRDFGLRFNRLPGPPRWDADGETVARERSRAVRISMRREATQGFSLVRVGADVLVPEALVLPNDGSDEPTGGYGSAQQSTLATNIPYVARIAVGDRAKDLGPPVLERVVNDTFSGPDDRDCFEQKAACILPRATVAQGTMLYVACLDSDEVVAFDTTADYEHAAKCDAAEKKRLHLRVESPTTLALDAATGMLGVFSAATRKLTLTSLATPTKTTSVTELPSTSATVDPVVARGRRLFHASGDLRIAADGRACASCHVDGREDGIVWPTPLGKRQTPMLAGRVADTAPYDWNGRHADLPTHIKETLVNLRGTGLPAEDLDALAAYITTMGTAVRRRRESTAVARGEVIFHSDDAECASCHTAETRFTDKETHTLGELPTPRYDTPSLAYVGLTAPYFHDGRYATLEELVLKCDGKMGHTKHLSPEDRSALVDYLRTL